jgi:hypothetical protein
MGVNGGHLRGQTRRGPLAGEITDGATRESLTSLRA